MKAILALFTLSLLVVMNTPQAEAGITDGRLDIYWVDVEGLSLIHI